MNRLISILTLLCALNLHSQQCNGSFGDPVFMETFGDNSQTGNSYGSPLPGGTTNYKYQGTSSIEGGYYTVAVNGRNGRRGWHDTPDHTADVSGEGYMLLVNAANDAGEFYRREVSGLCENQVFQFSAWIINMMPSSNTVCSPQIYPNVKFRIEDKSGNVLGEVNSGDLTSTASPQWKQFTFDFEIPPGYNTVDVVLMNNSGGHCGNDLAIDDISFRACSNKAVVETTYAYFTEGVCKNDKVHLTSNIENNPYLDPVFQWQESLDRGLTWTDLLGATQSYLDASGFADGHEYRFAVGERANFGNTNCSVFSDPITINYFLPPANPPADLVACNFSGTGRAVFDLTETIPEILGNADERNYFITFHQSLADAESGGFPIINMYTFQNVTDPQEIFVRVVDSDRGCSNTTSFMLDVLDLPVVNSPVTLYQCDSDGNGIADFNLQEANLLISSDPSFIYTYYRSWVGAKSEDPAELIVNDSSFSNSVSNRVYANVKDVNGCYSVAEVILQISVPQIPAGYEIRYDVCDDTLVDNDDTNGIAGFDFSDATNQIEGLFPGQNITVTYYLNEADALAEYNQIDPVDFRNETSPGEQFVYMRVDNNNNNACIELGPYVHLVVNQLPDFYLEEEQILCMNQLPYRLNPENPKGRYNYIWTDEAGNVISNNAYAEVNSGGTYKVTATTANGTDCEITKSVHLTESESATISDILIKDGMNNNTVNVSVTGIGDYEYSLDGRNYQDSGFFENVDGGEYVVYVRDKNGCGLDAEWICVVGYPVFFTPNGDGINDVWNIPGVGISCYNNAIITIFDRYGKFIKQIVPGNSGWDGTFRGNPMPDSDYWFSVDLNNGQGRTIRGHFTLKR